MRADRIAVYCPLVSHLGLRNDLYCVEWGVKLYSNQPTTAWHVSLCPLQKCAVPWGGGIRAPWFLLPPRVKQPSPYPEWHIRRFVCICLDHAVTVVTSRYTHRLLCSDCGNRLYSHAMHTAKLWT